MDRIDAHMHVWRLARGDYDWMTPDLGAIYRDLQIDDIWNAASAAGISQTILVQAAATSAETDYLLSLAAADDRVAGVIGWVDLEAPGAAQEISRYAKDARILGLRPMIADLADPHWILTSSFAPSLDAMAEYGLVFDGHARADLVPVMTRLADLHPALKIVLNHAGKPQIASGNLTAWRDDLRALGQRANVTCKLSGLLTEADTRTDDAALGEVVEHIRDCFGPGRILWGSDWPVLNLASTYAEWAAQSARLIDRYFPDHQHAVWSDNARRIYLNRPGA
ncbi:MAG: amidohydrolase [Alphaproteobacteria bacterium HGW-Alphaproteobacteria-18]|nr:MAG: amidohydrolase [Alphaproteobacteria bacterium HGW-Alphaproteobacteria-18]